jgi:hypothetical protein
LAIQYIHNPSKKVRKLFERKCENK